MSSRPLFFGSFVTRAFSLFVASILLTSQADALPRTWIGGNVDWVDAGSAANWSPADEPDADDEAIFNTANTVNLGSNNAVNGLTMSGGIDLFLNDFDLTVDGLVQAVDASTNLFIGGAASTLTASDVTINNAADIEMAGGVLSVHDFSLAVGLLDVNVGGELIGHGAVNLSEPVAAATTLLVNDGAISAQSTPLIIFGEPPAGTLSINAPNANGNGRVDLDGAGEAGVVNVNRNQTIDLNVAFADAFNGTMNLAHNSTFDSLNAWTLAGGSIIANNGFVAGGLGVPDVDADTSFIAGGLLTQTGGAISVVDADGTLQLDVNFTMSGGTFTNSGTAIFNGTTTITTATGYAPAVSSAETIINGTMTITDAAGDFNWDGPGTATTTINGAGSLSLTVDQVDTGNDTFGGVLNLNDDADLAVNNTANSWTMSNALNKNNAGTSIVSGDRVVIAGAVNANAGTLDMPAVTTSASANVNVAGTLLFGGASELAGGTITGAGLLRMEGTSTVTANTTIDVAAFDWDGLGTGTNHTINAGVVFTINSATLDSDGDMDDPVNLASGGSQLIVNGPTQWTAAAAVNANNAGAGTATIGGTSRFILSGAGADLNVNGNTNITAPLTLGASSQVDIDAGFVLDADGATTYSGVFIDGLGTFDPGSTNIVTADSTINPDIFDFDAGSWVVEAGAELTFNVVDYDTTAANAFNSTITLNNGAIFANTADAEFVMDGALNMNASGGFSAAEWSGDAIDIGNDAGALDADLNVTGDGNPNSQGRFFVPVDFNSDADVNIAAGAFLNLSGVVNFDTVNAANNAEFTGAGTMAFNNTVNVNEAVTLNMTGGTVDLDGNDATGEFINVDAPLVINAATMSDFGRINGGGGVNTLDVNNSVGTGVLAVNLDGPNSEWTLNASGVMNLINDNAEATLLAGNDVHVDGTVNVTGDVRATARLDIAGTVNISTAAQPLRLAGGNDTNDMNTLAGGTISGVGILAADTGKGLQGFGTINTAIDFDGTSDIVAEGGTLTYTNFITDVNTIRTSGAAAVFNFTQPVTTNVTDDGILMEGGTIQGAQLTVAALSKPLRGTGTVTNQVVNNGLIEATIADLTLQTAGNNNDWDGSLNTGVLSAINGSTLELRDVGAAFGFGGSVTAGGFGRVFSNGFALDFNPGSTLSLTAGKYESTSSTDLGGMVTVNAGATSTIEVENNFFLTFETGSATTLTGNLRTVNNNINIEAGATFAGGGALIVPDDSHMVADNLANIGVLLDMQGGFRPGNSEGIGRVDLFDYQQGNTGELFVEIKGTTLNAFDRLVASGDVVLDGYLNIDIDEVSPGVPFVPALGQTFNIITGNSVVGEFDYADVSGMPDGLSFHIAYLANAVQLQVVNTPLFSADFDDDGDVDPTDLAIWRGAFNLNQLGDADGDNDSDGADFLLWQQQFGSAPAVAVAQPAAAAVPEPSTAVLLLAAMAGAGWRRSRAPLRA